VFPDHDFLMLFVLFVCKHPSGWIRYDNCIHITQPIQSLQLANDLWLFIGHVFIIITWLCTRWSSPLANKTSQLGIVFLCVGWVIWMQLSCCLFIFCYLSDFFHWPASEIEALNIQTVVIMLLTYIYIYIYICRVQATYQGYLSVDSCQGKQWALLWLGMI